MKKTKRFIVTSHGWSASNWVAHALDLHPDIICSHSSRNEWASDPQIHELDNLRKNLRNYHKGYVQRQNRPLAEAYDEIASFGEADYHGSVHTYRLRDLPVLIEKYGMPEENYAVVNLIRHPLDLAWSGYGQFRDLFRYDINELYWTTGKVLKEIDFVYELASKHNLAIGDNDNLAFLGACAVLSSLKLDIDAIEKVKDTNAFDFQGFVKMEEVTSRPDILDGLVKRLTDQDIKSPQSYLDEVYKAGIINKHKKDNARKRPDERYAELNTWQREAFCHFLEVSGVQEFYTEVGYDLSFL